MGCVRSEHDCDHVVMTEKVYQSVILRWYLAGILLGIVIGVCISIIWLEWS